MSVDGGEMVVAGDVGCVRCGYNLRTLLEGGRCPECGLGVGVSVAYAREHLKAFRAPGRVVWAAGVGAGMAAVSLVPTVWWVAMYWLPGTEKVAAVYYGLGAVTLVMEAAGTVALAGLLWNAGPVVEEGTAVRAKRLAAGLLVGWQAATGLLGVAVEGAFAYGLWTMGPYPVPRYRAGEVLLGAQAVRIPGHFGLMVVGYLFVGWLARSRGDRAVVAANRWLTGAALLVELGVLLVTAVELVAVTGGWYWMPTAGMRVVYWGLTVAVVVVNVGAGAVFWPLVGRMGWRARG